MNERRVRELKVHYAAGLIEILRTVSEIGERSEEHAEAIRQVEKALRNCIDRSLPPAGQGLGLDHFPE